ncbi:V-type ATP synthase subunit A [Erysipelothrix sp. HDW6A]|uniref:V-type ATP synthase subunit A n=1 Tax=Erysipelothrix sp. HDW6A TaxID=2714928 RepID=UPI00140B31FC|nr:V-type ATP synthase subunit A [Erysipelothrix sp. HDW6A]QIK57242.1 V-type ATP synthase subunit A [Erysipelothrix sp. HDW6A]
MNQGIITKISGPLVVAENIPSARLYDTVYVSDKKLLGEIIEIRGNKSSIQVYEETSGIKVGEQVESLYRPLSIMLGPGILSKIIDGVGRDLSQYAEASGDYLHHGFHFESLDTEVLWEFFPLKKTGDSVSPGDFLGYVNEHHLKHYIMVPNGIEGVVESIVSGEHTVLDTVASIQTKDGTHEVSMMTRWPIRKSRPYLKKHLPDEPLITGQRVIDTFFPVAKGGTACVPGPFGSGKTVVQHQIAKWSDADIVIYVGCGERGNEITDVLNEFPEIHDPRNNAPLMNKTVLIANTSNMPVAAREASIYTGITIAEYFRDMGYQSAMMADSTSRWAEALREMSGRLQEMPGDEGYPAYLSSRLAEVYERAGVVTPLGEERPRGSVTMIGAVSPAGGDLSEPVTQATLRIVKVFWALDAQLAYARHFPAIHWLESYSLYQNSLERYTKKQGGRNLSRNRQQAMLVLKEESRLEEIVQLVGKDTLSDHDILKLEIARMIREDFLQQNAFQDEDTYTSYKKQSVMLNNIMEFYSDAKRYLTHDHIYIADIMNMKSVYLISRMKYVADDKIEELEGMIPQFKEEFESLVEGGED